MAELREVVAWVQREKFKRLNLKNESTNTKNYGGIACSSVEVFVMKIERRSNVKWGH